MKVGLLLLVCCTTAAAVTDTNRTVLAWFTTRHRQDADIKAGIGWFAQNVRAVSTASPTTHHLGENLTLDAFDFNQACAFPPRCDL